MLPKPSTCSACPLFTKGKGFVPDDVGKDAKYILIGEAPGRNEVEQGKPFVGKSGFVLRQWLIHSNPTLKLAVERGQVTLANTLRCLPPEIQNRPYPRGEDKRLAEATCRQYDNFTEGLHTAILFGESPQRLYFGDELAAEDVSDRSLGHETKGVMGRIGRVYNKDGKRWIFSNHPSHILRQPALVTHGQRALEIAADTEKEIEPNYMPWKNAMELL